MGRKVVLDLCRVWTPIPQVTEQLLHAAQLQPLMGKKLYVLPSLKFRLLSPFVQALAKANGGL